MHYVYILQSTKNQTRRYVGLCSDLNNRLREHNSGECKTTAIDRPWRIETAIFFRNEEKAHDFERYLKSGSGRAFSKKRF
jgi:predicted GIY-YIG superfamily endonuclease